MRPITLESIVRLLAINMLYLLCIVSMVLLLEGDVLRVKSGFPFKDIPYTPKERNDSFVCTYDVWPPCGFLGDCYNDWYIIDHHMFLNCVAGRFDQDIIKLSLDLDDCFSNKQGRIVSSLENNVSGSCFGCMNERGLGTVLTCTCDNFEGRNMTTSIQVNDWIGADNGTVKCIGGIGVPIFTQTIPGAEM